MSFTEQVSQKSDTPFTEQVSQKSDTPFTEKIKQESQQKEIRRIEFVTGKDTKNGKDACYYLLVDKDKKEQFKKDIKKDNINLVDYGKIIASCYGKEPNERVKRIMKKKYNVVVNTDGTID